MSEYTPQTTDALGHTCGLILFLNKNISSFFEDYMYKKIAPRAH